MFIVVINNKRTQGNKQMTNLIKSKFEDLLTLTLIAVVFAFIVAVPFYQAIDGQKADGFNWNEIHNIVKQK
jgi:riboflavin transporter FmnP